MNHLSTDAINDLLEAQLLSWPEAKTNFDRLQEIKRKPLALGDLNAAAQLNPARIRSIDPVVLFKIVLLQHLDGNTSLRGTLRRAQTDIAYRWFLGYTLLSSGR